MNRNNFPPECLEKLNITSLTAGELNCEIYHDYPKICWCPMALHNPTCDIEDSFVQYIQAPLCNSKVLESDTFMIGINILYSIWCIYLCIALGLTADAFFVPVLTRISDLLGLSETVAGLTLVALGNGAPDIFSAFASFGASDPKVAKLAVGALLGAGMFVTMLIAGTCMLITPFQPANWPIIRDIIGYLWALFWLTQCMFKGKIYLSDAIGFLVYYVLYVAIVIIWSKLALNTNKVEDVEKDIPPNPKYFDHPNGMHKNRTRYYSRSQDPNYNFTPNLGRGKKTVNPPSNLAVENHGLRSRAGTVDSVCSTLYPGAKNRARTLSNFSTYDKKSGLDIEPHNLEDAGPKTWSNEIVAALLPYDSEEMEGCVNIFFSIIMSPVYFLCKITTPIITENHTDSWNYPLTLLQCLALPWSFYLLLEQFNEAPFGADENGENGFPRYAIPIIFSAALFIPTGIFGSLEKPPIFYEILIVLGFLSSILWIYVEANEVVGLLTALGAFWKIDSTIMGLTFLAWANSVGDLVANIALTRIGKARTAVAACFGSPMLNLLVGVGLGCTAAILTDDNKSNGINLDLTAMEASLTGSLSLMMISLLFILPLTHYQTGVAIGTYKIIFYVVAVVLCIFCGAL